MRRPGRASESVFCLRARVLENKTARAHLSAAAVDRVHIGLGELGPALHGDEGGGEL